MPAPADASASGTVRDKTSPSLTIRRRIDAAPARVWSAWTDPEKLARWWGPGTPQDMRVTRLDVREGGAFHIGFGFQGEDHDVHGVYQEVVPGERLVFTWFWKSTPERVSLVTLTFRPDGEGCLFTLHHEQFFDEAARLGHTRGWTASIDKLEACFAQGDI
ncbi:SRPBCC family protein [Phreatobacter sp.]|uniref:SRPBCC family protein n=1 Tax=Phreatobacter sp. TaxID=1966341 RepID=UPI003F6FE057